MDLSKKTCRHVLMALAVAGIMLTAGISASSAQWQQASNGFVPRGAMRAGQESNGAPLFVCRAFFNGGLHPGKIRPEFRGCNIPYGGRENRVGRYEVLMDVRGVRWVMRRNGNVPRRALPAGREANGAPLYLCRAFFNGGLHPGKIRREFNGCNIPYGGREQRVSNYEVLIQRR